MPHATSLPGYHVARPRLVGALSAGRTGLVEAGRGYGKSSLAAEHARSRSGPTIRVGSSPDDDTSHHLVLASCRAARAAGGDRLCGPLDSPQVSTEAAIDGFVSLLDELSDRVSRVVDDAHQLRLGAAVALDTLVTTSPHPVMVLARQLPIAPATDAGAVLGTRQLALTPDELDELCGQIAGTPQVVATGEETTDRDSGELIRFPHRAAVGLPAGKAKRGRGT